jgi:hypothetical protein
MSRTTVLLSGVAAAVVMCALLLGGWLLMAAGANGQAQCSGSGLSSEQVPADLATLFAVASSRYSLGVDGAAILAGLTKIESDFGRNLGPSSAGAVGWTQFMPSTWQRFGVDADGDGRRNPASAPDAIFSTARYLHHLGAPRDWRGALFGYNHSQAYVDAVLAQAAQLASAGVAEVDCSVAVGTAPVGPVRRVYGGGRIIPIPGAPGESIDERIASDVEFLMRRYHVSVTAGYAPTGHAAGGEHPIGLAVDLVPGPGGSWEDVDALARWAEPRQNQPRPPFRWVGYNGDAGHGRGNHLHLSWAHGPAPSRRPPAPWVDVFVAP